VFKVGLGKDTHKFEKGKKLILCGVEISDSDGLKANSDGDVMIHALCNALSSAIGGGSLSTFADPLFEQGILDSTEYLKAVLEKIEKEYKINNISIAVEASKPKLEPFFDQMKTNIAGLLSIDKDAVGITATSGEGLTAFGRGEGISAIAVVCIEK